jgi:Permuted papain-like amidase enzyme, YaeF/YiiX, C92 family
MLWFACWIAALSTYERGAAEPTDGMVPPGWTGNPWGPAATIARREGKLPSIPMTDMMTRWDQWGRTSLRDGDIVFRHGDARTMLGFLPLSRFIAHATGSVFSHTGIIAIEDGDAVVYDCSSWGIQRQPLSVWMLDSIGSFGVKRLKPHLTQHIPGVLRFCRDVFERQVPFDAEFRMDDSKLYCVELTEKAFRSQGLALSQPVLIGDWENLVQYPLTALAFVRFSRLVLENPISLDQPVYLPGNERQGIWASPLLETAYPKKAKPKSGPPADASGRLSMRGDVVMTAFAIREMYRSYTELPWRLIGDVLVSLPSDDRTQVAESDGDRQPVGTRTRRSANTPLAAVGTP